MLHPSSFDHSLSYYFLSPARFGERALSSPYCTGKMTTSRKSWRGPMPNALGPRHLIGIRWHHFVRKSEVSLRIGLATVSDRIIRGRNAIFGHVARLPVNTPAHQAMLRQVELSVGRPQTLHGNVHQVDPVPNGPTNSAAITTMFPLRFCGNKLLVAVTRERRCGPSRLRGNDDVISKVGGDASHGSHRAVAPMKPIWGRGCSRSQRPL